LKPGHSDPEGETTARLLKELGYRVEAVGVSKVYRVTVESDSKQEVLGKAEEICRRLLTNPTKDDYVIAVEAEK
jgi:phosphoribosylformylglycinamidine synthase PurS subunit